MNQALPRENDEVLRHAGLPRRAKKVYWQMVAACLVELYQMPPLEAHRRIRDLRESLATAVLPDWPSGAELFYHQEPLYVACQLAGQPPSPTLEQQYRQTIQQRYPV